MGHLLFGVAPRRLIIVAGEGKTGTLNISTTLASLGLCVGHWNRTHNCSDAQQRQWTRAFDCIMNLPPEYYGALDYALLFNGIDAVADTPIPTVFPFLFAALPRSLVILSTRPSVEWAERRFRWRPDHADPIPMQYPRDSLRERYNASRASTFADTPLCSGLSPTRLDPLTNLTPIPCAAKMSESMTSS